MSDVQLKERNGSWLLFWRVAVGGGLIAMAGLIFNAGGLAGDVEENRLGIIRNEAGRLEMGRDVRSLERQNAASDATARSTERRLGNIEDAQDEIKDTLSEIKGLLMPSRAGNRQ